MKLFWNIYYFWFPAKSVDDKAIAYCRKNGKPYKKVDHSNPLKEDDDL